MYILIYDYYLRYLGHDRVYFLHHVYILILSTVQPMQTYGIIVLKAINQGCLFITQIIVIILLGLYCITISDAILLTSIYLINTV